MRANACVRWIVAIHCIQALSASWHRTALLLLCGRRQNTPPRHADALRSRVRLVATGHAREGASPRTASSHSQPGRNLRAKPPRTTGDLETLVGGRWWWWSERHTPEGPSRSRHSLRRMRRERNYGHGPRAPPADCSPIGHGLGVPLATCVAIAIADAESAFRL